MIRFRNSSTNRASSFQVDTFELGVIVIVSVFLTLTFDLPMQNVRDFLKSVSFGDQKSETVEKDVEPKDQQEKKSTEALFKSNGHLDSSNFDWGQEVIEKKAEETPKMSNGSYTNHRSSGEEHLDTFGRRDSDQEEREGDHLAEEEHEEEEEEEYSEEEEREGGNGAPVNEDLDDIWGSDK